MTGMFTVYLVDDDAGVLKSLSRLLRAKGYDVKPYSSPQVFLEEHDEAIPGCAILDVSMPDLDGLEIQDVLTTMARIVPSCSLPAKATFPPAYVP